jgi:hypothetical protein
VVDHGQCAVASGDRRHGDRRDGRAGQHSPPPVAGVECNPFGAQIDADIGWVRLSTRMFGTINQVWIHTRDRRRRAVTLSAPAYVQRTGLGDVFARLKPTIETGSTPGWIPSRPTGAKIERLLAGIELEPLEVWPVSMAVNGAGNHPRPHQPRRRRPRPTARADPARGPF